ncbi:MAG: cyclase family protein [Pirellulales bacterium]|nr:cyclase family protein [Pirellulales bacterium]
MRIYDITPPITPQLKVWPGDTPPERQVRLDMAQGDNITLSTLRTTVHAGAHADAPSHYGVDAASIENCPLETYLGPCQVVRIEAPRKTRITPQMIEDEIHAPRVLLSTGTFPNSEELSTDFAAISPELVNSFADAGVVLIGIDTPSVDLFDSKELPAHKAFLARGILILEGLRLADVPPGTYELIALPLPLVGFDGSPVRAVLRG